MGMRSAEEGPEDAPLDISLGDLSRILAELRKDRGLSLATVARGTGLSVSFLSLVEAGKSDISFGRLLRLVAFYGMALGDLLPKRQRSAAHVVRATERRHVYSPAERIHMYLLAPDTKRKMMPVITIYEPHGETAEFTSHPGEEFILVLEGVITLTFAGAETLVLQSGDSAYFDSSTPHYLTNPGGTRTILAATITPPTW
jgi:transcriptional regulator with XRE-family HTH domain